MPDQPHVVFIVHGAAAYGPSEDRIRVCAGQTIGRSPFAGGRIDAPNVGEVHAAILFRREGVVVVPACDPIYEQRKTGWARPDARGIVLAEGTVIALAANGAVTLTVEHVYRPPCTARWGQSTPRRLDPDPKNAYALRVSRRDEIVVDGPEFVDVLARIRWEEGDWIVIREGSNVRTTLSPDKPVMIDGALLRIEGDESATTVREEKPVEWNVSGEMVHIATVRTPPCRNAIVAYMFQELQVWKARDHAVTMLTVNKDKVWLYAKGRSQVRPGTFTEAVNQFTDYCRSAGLSGRMLDAGADGQMRNSLRLTLADGDSIAIHERLQPAAVQRQDATPPPVAGDLPHISAQEATPTGRGLRGRVIDCMGRPCDGRGPLAVSRDDERSLYAPPLDPIETTDRPRGGLLRTGLRIVDGLFPLTLGLRVALAATPSTGKDRVLETMARSQVEAVVFAILGSQSDDAKRLVERFGQDSVIITATSDPLACVRAAVMATTIAEAVRDKGGHALVVVDSLTRLVEAQSVLGIAAGEPAVRGSPASAHALLWRLTARAGVRAGGSVTAVYVVDRHDDAAAGLIDRHVDARLVFEPVRHSRSLRVDVRTSRYESTGPPLTKTHLEAAQAARMLLEQHPADPKMAALEAWLDAALDGRSPYDETVRTLLALGL